jgi:hypothetical protein
MLSQAPAFFNEPNQIITKPILLHYKDKPRFQVLVLRICYSYVIDF